MKHESLLTWEAVGILVGTIIGAGILGIPYVITKAGFWTGIIDILGLGFVVLLLYMYLGEVTLRTKGFHQLPGYAEKYLGRTGKAAMTFAMVFGSYGALIAYIIGVGASLAAIFGGDSVIYSLGFFVITAIIVLIGLKAVVKSESFMLPLVVLVIAFVVFVSFKYADLSNFNTFDITRILIPYGVILFAFLGAPAIPEMREVLIKNEKIMKKSILIGVAIPIIAYLLFAIAVIGVTGASTTEIATIGLGSVVGEYMVIIGNLLAFITMTTSFLTLGLALKDAYRYDYGINKNLAWALACFIPLVIAMSGIMTFIKIITLAGVISGGIEGTAIVLMALKAKKHGNRKPEYSLPMNRFIATLIIAVFVLGAGYYLWSII
jgi:tyrosine-specific transport protein